MATFRRRRALYASSSMRGLTVVLTGGSTGIGRETAANLFSRGAKVIIGCRDIQKAERATSEFLRTDTSGEIVIKSLDLASLTSIRQFAEAVLKEEAIHILINNAGVAGCPKWKTEDGFEMQFGVNHLGHFYLTLLLLDRLKQSPPSRIVTVASIAHYVGEINFEDINSDKNYNPLKAYEQSKLANILFTRELAKRIKGTGVTAYCLHPGVIHSELHRHLKQSMGYITGSVYNVVSKLFFKSVTKGIQTTLYCATEESIVEESGYYYSGCRRTEPSARAQDDDAAKRLWELSESMVDCYLE